MCSMFEVVFLFSLAVIWIVFATVQDLRSREIANWLNFSLVVFALGFRLFYSLFEMGDFSFFYQGLIGYGIFFALGNLFYYTRMFAGGDAKLLMALGAILPVSNLFMDNLRVFFVFLFLFLIVGAFYGFVVTIISGFRNLSRLKKELVIQFQKRKRMVFWLSFVGSLFLLMSFFWSEFFYLGLIAFILPYFYLYVKSVDEACMVRKVSPSKLTVGDWLYEDVEVGKKVVLATWDGLTEEDLKLLSKKKFVLVRYGIQFAPVFLISFILFWLGFTFSWSVPILGTLF